MTHPKASPRKRAEPQTQAAAAPMEAKPLGPGVPTAGGAPPDRANAPAFEGQYRIDIPKAGFEGPLDLLLHLIQQHELDILDIPVAFITERFLEYLRVMRALTIDIASEYLVMAATLVHIKSKMLLPVVPADQEDGLPGEDDEDPRAELVRRLLEYQKYKAAAGELAERGTLGKDVFGRGGSEPVPQGPAPFQSLGVFSLLDAFEKVLKRTNVRMDHEVIFDRISITDRMVELTEKLGPRRTMIFDELVLDSGRSPTRFDIVITFLAILEMAKLRMVRLYQSGPLSPLHVELTLTVEEDQEAASAEPVFLPPGEGEG